MVQTLDVISVNLWQILVSLCNLLIMFLILRRFLFEPVQRMLSERQQQVDDVYAAADRDRADAGSMRTQYEHRLAQARDEADGIVRNATQTAQRRGEEIVNEASAQAAHLKQKAQQEIALERRQMLTDVRSEISDMAVSIASKVVEREINAADHASLVDEFIRNVGEEQ
ncbi:MAG: F0F1 ATP synthase subunit B [bacterium]|nr:F0F1 ATP synthase subunit B [bacterium]